MTETGNIDVETNDEPALQCNNTRSIEDEVNYSALESTFSRWLYFEREPDELAACIAAILANRLDSEPVWMFLVGPSSSLKSRILKATSTSSEIVHISNITKNTLLSGARDKKGKDMSLLPMLNNKVLVIKDFTTVLSMHPYVRAEIFGQLRDAYDGWAHKGTGLGTVSHSAKFGLLAGCTSAIETLRSIENMLGERFMYFRNLQPDVKKAYEKAMENTDSTSSMVVELADAVEQFLDDATIPSSLNLDEEEREMIIRWARCVVMMRSSVSRDTKTREIDVPVQQTEYGGRFTMQSAALYSALTVIVDKSRATRILKHIVQCAIPQIRFDVLAVLAGGTRKVRSVAKFAKASVGAVHRSIEEMQFLGILNDDNAIMEPFASFMDDMLW